MKRLVVCLVLLGAMASSVSTYAAYAESRSRSAATIRPPQRLQ